MIKRTTLLITSLVLLVACKEQTGKGSALGHQLEDRNKNALSSQADPYCELRLGDQAEQVEFELRSSNSLREGTITTTFELIPSIAFYDAFELEVSFLRVLATDDPKLAPGNFRLRPYSLSTENSRQYFSIGSEIISEKTHRDAIASGQLDDIHGSYVLLSEGTNEFIVHSVEDIGTVEESLYYTTGKQRVKGSATALLLRVATNTELVLKVDFDIEHEWSLSK